MTRRLDQRGRDRERAFVKQRDIRIIEGERIDSNRCRRQDRDNVRGPRADRIEDLLPQTQCTKCGYAGCRPYAEAIAAGLAEINQCPPGGEEGVARLAGLLQRKVIPLNPVNGYDRPRPVAYIDESLCIDGCTLCVEICPLDSLAINPDTGKAFMHVDECWYCGPCAARCPTGAVTVNMPYLIR